MATHECTKCLAETIQGISEVKGHLVLPGSVCTSGGIFGSHSWTPKGNEQMTNSPLHLIDPLLLFLVAPFCNVLVVGGCIFFI